MTSNAKPKSFTFSNVHICTASTLWNWHSKFAVHEIFMNVKTFHIERDQIVSSMFK